MSVFYSRNIIVCFIWLLLAQCCQLPTLSTKQNVANEALNYTEVGKMMDSVTAPYVLDISKGAKRLVFIGCKHQQDSTHQQYKVIEKYYHDLKPQLAFNEGGQLPKWKHYPSKYEAIRKDGETGMSKYCADKLGISLLNGDTPDSVAFAMNAKKNNVRKLFIYYVMERLVIPYKYGAYEDIPFEALYNKLVPKWFKHYPLAKNEKSFIKFKAYYKVYTKTNFLLTQKSNRFDQDSVNVELFDYVNPNCEFCEIGRSSKMLRDSILIAKIKTAFKTKNRILVTFGHGHALALSPVLKNMFDEE
jgi:hypothetical protein